jgi:hypothetical protein
MFLTHGLFSLFLRSHRCFQGVVHVWFKPSLKDLLTKSKFLCYAEDWPTLLVRLEASRLEHPCAKMTWWTLPLDSLPKPKVRECSWMGLVVGPKTSALFNEGLAQFRNPYYCFKAMQHVPHLAPSSQLNVPDERWMNFLRYSVTMERTGTDKVNTTTRRCQEHLNARISFLVKRSLSPGLSTKG